MSNPYVSKSYETTEIPWVSVKLSQNELRELPIVFITLMKDSLESLDLSKNYFFQLEHFPHMDKLKSLILDDCNIFSIQDKAFDNLTNLKHLSLQWNKFTQLPSAIMHPNLRSLTLNGQIANGRSQLSVKNEMFAPMTNLKTLNMVHFDLKQPLAGSLFKGLVNLKNLNLSFITTPNVENDAMSLLPNLTSLVMTFCDGYTNFTFEAVRGPEKLQLLDLTSTQIFPSNDNTLGDILPTLETLNLGNTKLNMDKVGMAKMKSLQILDMSKNVVRHWNQKQFTENSNLKQFKMSGIQFYISLTEEMLADFKSLDILDLTSNTFICNNQVPQFYILAETSKTLKVIRWYHGVGYVCVDNEKNGTLVSFYDYVTEGNHMDDPFENEELNGGVDILDKNAIVGLVLGGFTLLAIFSVMINLVYQNWWVIQFKYARWKWLRSSNLEDDGKKSKNSFDAFVSYSHEDSQWVNEILAPNLEPEFKLCIHERDFQVGQTITDNIVNSLSKSNNCLIIMSQDYLTSKWCNFEAKIAHSMMKERLTLIILDDATLTSKQMPTFMKPLLKTKTYISWDEQNPKFWRRVGKALLKINHLDEMSK